MKVKYRYDTLSGDQRHITVILIIMVAVICFIKLYSDSKGTNADLILLICLPVMMYFVLYTFHTSIFTADDSGVTFGRIFKKRIAYSSIRGIDIRTEVREQIFRRAKRSRVTEIITFHCDDGDHSFAGIIEPSRKSLTYVQGSTGVSAEDKANSAFSRLKYFIESKRYL
ncbi:hypothetical protein [Ruminococcus sp.]|uniref:hypothetical protein n=1 Tax=Ruminococcus sp. TaxID=41978 RepID=UPI0025D9BF2C|nr:hypothetical protein [Ruminococcus sp.]MBQ8966767.1 hypothetical protein [Ruminococcus sp.]